MAKKLPSVVHSNYRNANDMKTLTLLALAIMLGGCAGKPKHVKVPLDNFHESRKEMREYSCGGCSTGYSGYVVSPYSRNVRQSLARSRARANQITRPVRVVR